MRRKALGSTFRRSFFALLSRKFGIFVGIQEKLMHRLLRHTVLLTLLQAVYACAGIHDPQVNYLSEPLSVGGTATVFSWDFGEDSLFVQSGYRVVIKGVWDSGEVSSADPRAELPRDVRLQSFTDYRWKVEAWDAAGSKRRGRSRFRTGVFPADGWTASWIGAQAPVQPLLRKQFRVGRGLKQGLLAVSSTEGHLVRIDDKAVCGEYSIPTSLYGSAAGKYRVYDVTALLSKGNREMTILSGGKHPAVLAELHLFYKDGSHDILCTDTSWEVASKSPYTLLPHGWRYEPTEDSLSWSGAQPAEGYALLLPDETPLPSREKLIPLEEKQGDTLRIFDFGRPLRTSCTVEASGEAGDAVSLQYFDAAGAPVGEDVLVLGRKGRTKWACAFSERTFQTVRARFKPGTKVKVQADIPAYAQAGWMQLRGQVEGFALDPSAGAVPIALADSLYTRFGDRALLEEAYPAFEQSVLESRKKNQENYQLMEKFATVLGKDATPWTEALRMMSGKK